MFKGFQNTSRTNGFNGFPALNFQMNNEAYGFSGCTFWLDAAYGLNTQTDGIGVSIWRPRFGVNFAIQNTAANQPVFVLSDTNFNNLPSVNFNGYTTKWMTFNQSLQVNSNQYTITVVYKNDSIQNAQAILGLNSYNTGGILASGGTISSDWDGFGRVGSTSLNAGNEGLVSYIATITNTDIYINGSSSATGNSVWTAAFERIGGDMSGAGSIVGRIAEILIFNRNFTTSELSALQTRLNSKYAIY